MGKQLVLISALLLLSFLSVKAQMNLLWGKTFTGSYCSVIDVVTDAAGNTYSTGVFYGTIDFDPGSGVDSITTYGDYDIFLLKLDSAGNFVWVKRVGSPNHELSSSIAISDSGYIAITGTFNAPLTFANDTDSITVYRSPGAIYNEVFIAKYYPDGNVIWAKSIGGGVEAISVDVAIDENENVYTTGYYQGTVDFDPGTGVFNITGIGIATAFISKLNSAGNFVWARAIKGTSEVLGYALTVNDGKVFVTGTYYGNPDFDPGAGVYNMQSSDAEIFILKLDTAGIFIWAGQLNCSMPFIHHPDIAVDDFNNIFVAGIVGDSADFDPGPDSTLHSVPGPYNMFVLKLDSAGNFRWVNTFGSSYADEPSITVSNAGNVFASAKLYGSITHRNASGVTDTTFSTPSYTIAVMELNPSGDLLAMNLIEGGQALVDVHAISKPRNGVIHVGCEINSQTDVDPRAGVTFLPANSTLWTGALLKYRVCTPTWSSLTADVCGSYVLNSETYTSSGTYTQTTTNASNCDSIITLYLTIRQPSADSARLTACDSIIVNTITYTSTGVYTQAFTNSAGCDSILTLNLTIGHPASFTLDSAACDSIVINNQAYTTTGIYTQALTTSAGCDSTLTLDLTIGHPTSSTLNVTACQSYTLNTETYDSSGPYVQVRPNAQNCDSIITLNLTIESIDTGVTDNADTLVSNYSTGPWQWLDCATGLPLPGENESTLATNRNGNYAVVVSNAHCTDTSGCFTIAGVGIETAAVVPVKVYPNPASEYITFDIKVALPNAYLNIYSLLGSEKMLSVLLSQQTIYNLHTASWAKGLYFYTITTNSFHTTGKIALQ